MEYRHLIGTDLWLSTIGFGLWTLSTDLWEKTDESDGIKLIQEGMEQGLTYFDTADSYGDGYGEMLLAKALDRRRHEVVISTKVGYDFYNAATLSLDQKPSQRFEPQFIRYACEQSLRRLGTDYIDIYQLHHPGLDIIGKDEVFDTLEDLVTEGKIRYYGSVLGSQGNRLAEGEASMRRCNIRAVQIIYNILDQVLGRRLLPIAEYENTGVVVRAPHARDVLTGRYPKSQETNVIDNVPEQENTWLTQAIRKAREVEFLAEGTGRSLAQSAIKFCLADPSVVSTLPNILSQEDIIEYTGALRTPEISTEEFNKLEELWHDEFPSQEISTVPE